MTVKLAACFVVVLITIGFVKVRALINKLTFLNAFKHLKRSFGI